jgi:hypothetical protein
MTLRLSLQFVSLGLSVFGGPYGKVIGFAIAGLIAPGGLIGGK